MDKDFIFDDIANNLVIFNEITFNRLWKLGADAYLLYSFYYRVAKFQRNRQPWANNEFTMKGLGWGKDRLKKAKGLLRDNGFIEDETIKNEDGKVSKWVIKLKYLQQSTKNPPPPENHPVVLKPTNTHNYEYKIHITTNKKEKDIDKSISKEQDSTNDKKFLSGSASVDELDLSSEPTTNIGATDTKTDFVEEKFEEFWKGYLPVHTGKGAKSVAKTKFVAAVKKKNNPDDIIAGMKRYIAFCHSNNCYTQNVPTFLNQEHWKDYLVEEKDSKGVFVNSFPISVTPSTLNKEEILDVIKTHLQTWTQENPVWTERIKAISAKAKDESDLFHTQKSLQMALELAKEIFRYKDSPGVRNSLVDPLFWLSCRSCFSDLEIQASCSGFLYVGYQLRKLAESD